MVNIYKIAEVRVRHFLAIIFLIFTSDLLQAQTQPLDSARYPYAQYTAEGRMLTVKLIPGDKAAKLFFVGKKVADLDFQKDHKLLSIVAISNDKKEVLKFTGTGDSYEVADLPKWKTPYELSLKSELKGQVEEIKVKVKSKP